MGVCGVGGGGAYDVRMMERPSKEYYYILHVHGAFTCTCKITFHTCTCTCTVYSGEHDSWTNNFFSLSFTFEWSISVTLHLY